MAHRGWHTGELAGMENSMASLRRAFAEGYRYLEIDVHATSDGVVVVCHDATLDRTTDGRGPIAAQRWDAVRTALVGGREAVPSLRHVLGALPRALLNIDVKSDSAVEPTLALISELDAWDRVCLASFSAGRLIRLRAKGGPRLITACSPAEVFRLRTRSWLRQRGPGRMDSRGHVGGQLAQVPARHGPVVIVDRAVLATAHAAGMEVHVWTVDEPARMRELLDLGVDGLISDRPDVLREVLAERGQWPGP
ncbi:MAG TPA: glycerophosphodiester phosphodiesterase [Pseudonocardia sp.]|jgi:glycerophosphoryl diester phosphodiesterase